MSMTADFLALQNEFDNSFVAPAGIDVVHEGPLYEPVQGRTFVRFSHRAGNDIARAVSGGLSERQGRIWLQINIPQGDGLAVAYELADQFRAIFKQGKRLDDYQITIHESSANTTPAYDGFYGLNVSIRYTSLRRS